MISSAPMTLCFYLEAMALVPMMERKCLYDFGLAGLNLYYELK